MLQPIVFGLNYQTADFELRDRLAFATEEIPFVLKRMINSGVAKEAVLLSTCNRTELYCISHDIDFVINALCDIHNVCPRTVRKHSYIFQGEDCAHHLFRVISGLESMVLGETEIVAQIKDAMALAKNHGGLGSNLSGLFQMALAVEKDVRNHSAINNVAISMGHAVVNYVEERILGLANRNVLFIGAGQMMQQIAPHFNYLALDDKLVLNRTLANGEALANKIDGRATNLENLASVIDNFGTVIACCASNVPFIDENILAKDIQEGSRKLIIDISMPLIISKNLKRHANLEILTVDDIAKLVDVGLEKRKVAALKAEEVIATKLEDYHSWQRKRGLAPLIKRLREDSDKVRQESLALAEKQLLNGESPVDVLKQFSIQLTNRLLHNPTVNICSSEGQLQEDLVDLVSYLYGLEV